MTVACSSGVSPGTRRTISGSVTEGASEGEDAGLGSEVGLASGEGSGAVVGSGEGSTLGSGEGAGLGSGEGLGSAAGLGSGLGDGVVVAGAFGSVIGSSANAVGPVSATTRARTTDIVIGFRIRTESRRYRRPNAHASPRCVIDEAGFLRPIHPSSPPMRQARPAR